MKKICKTAAIAAWFLLITSCGGGGGGGSVQNQAPPPAPPPPPPAPSPPAAPPPPPPDTAALDNRVVFSSFLGEGIGSGIAVDAAGNIYVAGDVFETFLAATPGAFQATVDNDDAFVAKLAPDGSLIYLTFFGGEAIESVYDLAVDASGHAIVSGSTVSSGFPTVNAIQSVYAGEWDVFVTKLSPDGSNLVFSTYLGGNGQDSDAVVAVDATGDIYIAGGTFSPDFPVTPTGFQQAKRLNRDLFVAKLGGDGSLIYSTFLGGANFDGQGNGIAVDNGGNAYVFTQTGSGDFPTTFGVLQPAPGGGFSDYAVTKLSPDGSALLYSTYLGGSGAEQPLGPMGIAVDATGHAYLAASTDSSDFPTVNAYQDTKATFQDGIVAKLSPTADQLVYSTYLGGPNPGTADPQACCLNFGHAIAVDASGNAFVAGHTTSPDFPVVDPLDAAIPATIDLSNLGDLAFVARLSPDGAAVTFSSLVGGAASDFGESVAIDANGDVYLTGTTFSAGFPARGALAGCPALCEAPFVMRISNP